jgi:hypothetical protein
MIGARNDDDNFNLSGSAYTYALPDIAFVDIEIKPGNDPNSINLSLGGNIPVAILGSDSFDAADVNGTTLAFGPNGASINHSQGPHFGDVNDDGFTDLLARFRTEEAGVAFGDLEACVGGEMLDGALFFGCDAIRTVPHMDGDGRLDTEEAAFGTNALDPDTDGAGFSDGEEVLELGTDPLDPDLTLVPEPGARLMTLAGIAMLMLLAHRRSRHRSSRF